MRTYFAKLNVLLLAVVLVVAFRWRGTDAVPSSQRATFVPPAAPTSLQTQRSIISGYGLHKFSKVCKAPQKCESSAQTKPSHKQASQALLAKRGKSATTAAKGGKIQVKLLKYVEGTGKVGDVVMVAPAFFENKLKRSNSAVMITDDEVEKQTAEKLANAKEKRASAIDTKEKIDGMHVSITRRAGPEGHLFGGVGKKDILNELKKQFPKGVLEGKQIKVQFVKDEEGTEIKGDIKDLGKFTSRLSLLKDVNADFYVEVLPEQ